MATSIASPAASAWHERKTLLRSKMRSDDLRVEYRKLYELRQSVGQVCARFENQQHILTNGSNKETSLVRLATFPAPIATSGVQLAEYLVKLASF